ncbi:LLM class flavin-dependent oxidoreductase [Actinomadura sp. LD22]|uniref:LLM class flavin-dependent oxidoreductase n=1 Tax=Actinomadura physcomitrii TaxID=2650748 RepID=A0A6I4M293_9ACTN|nr:LLM class flavin-dependent oxidoreductase [Actinomadura physcomitrii]MVZ99882.1 LLM class flavin-dependent oxidoreductase [Actinomadura physcomitrii]
MEIAVRVPPCVPIPEYVDFARQMEAGGIDRIAVPDSQLLWRDVWAVLAVLAVSTTELNLSVAVTNPTTRHAAVTAGATRTIAELAPDRFHVAVGAGESSVSSIGMPPARNKELERAVSQVRTLLSGAEVDDPVQPWRLHDPRQVPVLIAANGPRNLASAGRVADGAVITGTDWKRDRDMVRDAAVAAGRDPESLDIIVTRPCVVTDDPERDSRYFMPYCLRMAQSPAGAAFFGRAGIEFEVPPPDKSLGDLRHPDNWDALVDIASQWVPVEAALWFARKRTLFGSPAEVAAAIADLADAGVTRLALAHTGAFTLPTALVSALIDSVLPALRSLKKGA